MRKGHSPLLFISLLIFVLLNFHISAEGEIEKNSQNKITTDWPAKKTITLKKRLTPSERMIEFSPSIPPRLIEPSIIRFNIQNLPRRIEERLSPVLLKKKEPNPSTTISKKLANTDTLINGLIQNILLDKDTYKQGEVATLHITTVLPLIKPEVQFLHRNYKLYPAGKNSYQGFLAVPMNADIGKHYMTLRYEEDGIKKSLRLPFKVISGDFAKEDTAELEIHILTEETLEMLKYEGRYFSKAYSKNFDTLFCDSDFIWPAEGSITSLFGIARRYNNDLDKWSHKAIDIANIVGTDVLTANNGIVVMAKELEGHGKSIVIAHGQGIHTVYLHLDKISVEEGDTVIKGEKIGKMGKTGMCSGPNLHFQIMVNRVPTDPRYWIPDGNKLKKGSYVTPKLVKSF